MNLAILTLFFFPHFWQQLTTFSFSKFKTFFFGVRFFLLAKFFPKGEIQN
jgi:hypothetical protein